MNNDLLNKIEDIQEERAVKSIEAHSQAQNEWRDAVRRKIIFKYLPLGALGIIIIVWIIMQIPTYDRCFKKCMENSQLPSMQKQEDCEFMCRIKNPL